MKAKANLIKVKVYPKDLKSIPDILPYNKLLNGEAKELELTKKEIIRCMQFGDVFDMATGNEVLVDEVTLHDIVEYVEDETVEEPEGGKGEDQSDPNPDEGTDEEEVLEEK